MKLQGLYTALVTPFSAKLSTENGDPGIDIESLEQLVSWQLEVGVDGLVVCGSTGEAATLSREERSDLIQRVLKLVNGKVPVIAGTGTNFTTTTVEYTKDAEKLGVSALLISTPYYNKPTQEGIYRHFERICESTSLPVILYDIPGRTGIEFSLDTIRRLSEIENIIGIKDATKSSQKALEINAQLGEEFYILSGEDQTVCLSMCAGGSGAISASANVIPAEMKAITDYGNKGEWDSARASQTAVLSKIEGLFLETNPSPAKAVLKMWGKISDDSVRLPLVPVMQTTRDKLQKLFL